MTSTGPITSDAPLQDTVPRDAHDAATAAEPLASEGRRTGRGFITSYGTGRSCDTAGCDTLLSRYNAAGSCALHSMKVGSDSVTI